MCCQYSLYCTRKVETGPRKVVNDGPKSEIQGFANTFVGSTQILTLHTNKKLITKKLQVLIRLFVYYNPRL